MSLKFRILILLLLVLSPGLLHAKGKPLLTGVREVTLSNGMKFLLLRRSGAPVFSAYVRVKVGGVDEVSGKTGIAHLLEHMAFKGTDKIGTRDFAQEKILLEKIEVLHAQKIKAKGKRAQQLDKQMKELIQAAAQLVVKEEFSKIYHRNGATGLNATTGQDLTSYFVTLPATKLKLWAYLESERLKHPVFREFYSERDVVQEERRMRVDDSPFGKLYEAFVKIAFRKSPYRRPTIGYQVDLEKLSATDLKKFYEKYYVPSNMVGAVVGDIDLDETEQVLRASFGSIPKAPSVKFIPAQEPEPKTPKQTQVRFDAEPTVMWGYLKPNLPHPDDYVFDVLDQILCQGRSSRLYQSLVVEQQLVQKISCSPSTPGSRLPNLFFVYASIRKGHRASEVLKAFDEQLKTIEKQGVSEQELQKAKKNLMSQWYFDLQSNQSIARALSYFEAISGSWKYIVNHQEKIQAITSGDVQRVIQTYLKANRRRVAVLKPLSS